jgi:hypothetical protein
MCAGLLPLLLRLSRECREKYEFSRSIERQHDICITIPSHFSGLFTTLRGLSFISLFSLCFPSVLLSVFFLLFKMDCRFLLPSLQKRKNKASLPKRKLHRTRKGTRDARKRGGSNELGTNPRHTWAHKQKENEWVKTKEKWRKAIKRTKARPTLFSFPPASPSPDVQYFT